MNVLLIIHWHEAAGIPFQFYHLVGVSDKLMKRLLKCVDNESFIGEVFTSHDIDDLDTDLIWYGAENRKVDSGIVLDKCTVIRWTI